MKWNRIFVSLFFTFFPLFLCVPIYIPVFQAFIKHIYTHIFKIETLRDETTSETTREKIKKTKPNVWMSISLFYVMRDEWVMRLWIRGVGVTWIIYPFTVSVVFIFIVFGFHLYRCCRSFVAWFCDFTFLTFFFRFLSPHFTKSQSLSFSPHLNRYMRRFISNENKIK